MRRERKERARASKAGRESRFCSDMSSDTLENVVFSDTVCFPTLKSIQILKISNLITLGPNHPNLTFLSQPNLHVTLT